MVSRFACRVLNLQARAVRFAKCVAWVRVHACQCVYVCVFYTGRRGLWHQGVLNHTIPSDTRLYYGEDAPYFGLDAAAAGECHPGRCIAAVTVTAGDMALWMLYRCEVPSVLTRSIASTFSTAC